MPVGKIDRKQYSFKHGLSPAAINILCWRPFEVIFVDQAIQRPPADPQGFGGVYFVALLLLQNPHHVLSLDLAKIARVRGRLHGLLHVNQRVRQVIEPDSIFLSQYLCAFQDVGQLAHVSRPIVAG